MGIGDWAAQQAANIGNNYMPGDLNQIPPGFKGGSGLSAGAQANISKSTKKGIKKTKKKGKDKGKGSASSEGAKIPDNNWAKREVYVLEAQYPDNSGYEIPEFLQTTWIVFTGNSIGKMDDNSWNINIEHSSSQYAKYILKFAMPREIMESLQHTYGSAETFSAKISEKYAQLGGVAWKQIQGIMKTFKGKSMKDVIAEIERIFKSNNVGQALIDKAAEIAQNLIGQSELHFYKNDAPLIYKTSERRVYEFVFHLVAIKDRYDDVVFPVRLLQYLSSPTKDLSKGEKDTMANTKIKPPFYFEVKTEPDNEFLYIKRAVIRSVNPVFKAPWVNGLPTYCELRLSIEEIDPLFDDVFNRDDVVSGRIEEKVTGKSNFTTGTTEAAINTQEAVSNTKLNAGAMAGRAADVRRMAGR